MSGYEITRATVNAELILLYNQSCKIIIPRDDEAIGLSCGCLGQKGLVRRQEGGRG